MQKGVIEILSPFSSHEPLHRMKIGGLIKNLSKNFNLCEFGSSLDNPDAVIINCLHQDLINDSAFVNSLKDRFIHSIVMLMMADFYPNSIEYLGKWSPFVDVFLVPTVEMRDFIQAYTDKKVEVLFDPIDFGLEDSRSNISVRSQGLKVMWFGYPESYGKSMGLFEEALVELHQSGEIEYHIVSKNSSYGKSSNGYMHEYNPENFLELMDSFDVCVLSHFPMDFSLSTQWKSEYKAVLAINRGLPVVASNTPSYRKLLNECGQGEFLFSTKDQLREAISKLMAPAKRLAYLKTSQEMILKNYSARKMSEDWVKLLDSAKKHKWGANSPV